MNNECAGLYLCFHEMGKILYYSLCNLDIFSYINILPKNYLKCSVLCRISVKKEPFPSHAPPVREYYLWNQEWEFKGVCELC